MSASGEQRSGGTSGAPASPSRRGAASPSLGGLASGAPRGSGVASGVAVASGVPVGKGEGPRSVPASRGGAGAASCTGSGGGAGDAGRSSPPSYPLAATSPPHPTPHPTSSAHPQPRAPFPISCRSRRNSTLSLMPQHSLENAAWMQRPLRSGRRGHGGDDVVGKGASLFRVGSRFSRLALLRLQTARGARHRALVLCRLGDERAVVAPVCLPGRARTPLGPFFF